ncbi:hypothetical protein T4B_14736 [Trichinella pseudospiralis]|uniref:Uncharacterized protein n=1 Tax=Trichinella pseudospiralis TaxID=6337 RepID=A0A0V1GQZ8_TRIPS|nr:hypothetical protein T4B_14736 [Trichinella pseudospiralis]
MESEDCLWSRKEQIQNRYRNVQAADMVVYVQNNLWAVPQTHKQLKQRWDNYGSCLCPGESTLLPPCHIKFL